MSASYAPGEWVFRWWETLPDNPDQQPLQVVRVNRVTLTVRTTQGSTFRLPYHEVGGHADRDLVEWAEAQAARYREAS